MKSVDETELRTIANALKVDYQALPTPFNRRSLGTRMSRDFQVPKGKLYDLIADVGAHHRFFPHLKALNVIDSAMLAGAIGDNQVVVVEGLAEGGSKLGVKLFTLKPPDRIEGELMTDPFVSAAGVTAHNKEGSIVWAFQSLDEKTTRMEVESDFGLGANTAYVRGAVDYIWLDFFENVMVHLGEITAAQKMCAPF